MLHAETIGRLGRRLAAFRQLDVVISIVLVACSLALTLPRLATPSRYFFDEILYAYTAREIVRGNPAAQRWDGLCAVGRDDEACLASHPEAQLGERIGKIEWTHPPLSKQLIAAGIALIGDTPHGRRLPAALAGAVGVALLYQLGLALTRRRAVALLAAALLLLDGLWFVESRLALPDIFLAVALLGAMVAFAAYLLASAAGRVRPLLLTGAWLGLAIATKWSAVFVWGLVGLAVLVTSIRDLRHTRSHADRRAAVTAGARAVAWAAVALVGIPLVIYLLTHVPFFAAGNGLADFAELQWRRFVYHRDYGAAFDYGSRWWQWPLALRPAWYGATSFADGRVANIYANGNPLLFWTFLPALAWVGALWARRWWRHHRPQLLVLATGFLGAWLPWAFIDRATLVYHFLPAVPFGCLAVAVGISDLYRADTGWRRTLAVEFVILVALGFAFFYPFYAFVGLDPHDVELRLWLPSWR